VLFERVCKAKWRRSATTAAEPNQIDILFSKAERSEAQKKSTLGFVTVSDAGPTTKPQFENSFI